MILVEGIRIERLWVDKTFGGILEGERNCINKVFRERTARQLKEKHGVDAVVLFPQQHILPRYRFTAARHSRPLPDEMQWRLDCISKDLPLGFPWDFYLYYCWFQHSLDGNLVEFVKAATHALEWGKHAQNTRCV